MHNKIPRSLSMEPQSKKTAILLGATGLTGGMLLGKLLDDGRYQKIKVFGRRPLPVEHPKLEQHQCDLTQLVRQRSHFTGHEVFCCIGTTKAKTPDREAYVAVDKGIPVSAAVLCKEQGIPTFLVISAMGADPKSAVFYNRTKGQMEAAVLSLGLAKVHVLQPGLINGPRSEKRTGEDFLKSVMKFLDPLLVGPLKKYRSIAPQDMARAMVWLANHPYGRERIPNDIIQELAKNQ
ncbi:NAD(P)H-binding protein [Maribacter sp. 2307ULW6-5]|uniref:NAD(P)H-binding protein n=1 Tax=Maribacter sp. 2307ULW6-5 TaxID=3386275 RepID=UPI0039BC415B